MFPGFSCFLRSVQNELDNIQIYVRIILKRSVQVTSRCNTSEVPDAVSLLPPGTHYSQTLI